MRRTIAIALLILALAAACSGSDAATSDTTTSTTQGPPERLAFATTTSTTLPPLELGTETEPFGEIDQPESTGVGITPSGIVTSFYTESGDSLIARSACGYLRPVSSIEPIARPHVLLDPGHGGSEPGAVSANGLTEAAVNLDTALRTKAILESRGAIVELTRTDDTAITLESRGRIAQRLQPGLFVSVHHNGSSTNTPSTEPGLIAFTKLDSEPSSNFGGLFYNNMAQLLADIKADEDAAFAAFEAELNAHEVLIDNFDASVQARNNALVANGQIAPPPTTQQTNAPATTVELPRSRSALETTTTRPATAPTTVVVPETITPPADFAGEILEPFFYIGGGNRGVRSWINSDGDDFLGVLRHSGDVPAALVEFLYLTNPAEAELLESDAYLDRQALALADSITQHFAQTGTTAGYVADQNQPADIGGGGGRSTCTDTPLG